MTANRTVRIAVFIDGTYFNIANEYYKTTHQIKSPMNPAKFLEFLRKKISGTLMAEDSSVVVSQARMYIGLSTKFTSLQLRWKKDFMLQSNIDLRIFPMERLPTGKMKERGVDVALTADTVLTSNKYDVMVLVSGDGDFIPLIESMRELGKKTILAYWQMPSRVSGSRTSLLTNTDLVKAVNHSISLKQTIDEDLKKERPLVMDMFGIIVAQTPEADNTKPQKVSAVEPKSTTKTGSSNSKQRGRIIEKRGTVGYIRPDSKKEKRKIPFMKWNVGFDDTNFDEVEIGKTVEYEISVQSPRSKGIAVNIRIVEDTKMPAS